MKLAAFLSRKETHGTIFTITDDHPRAAAAAAAELPLHDEDVAQVQRSIQTAIRDSRRAAAQHNNDGRQLLLLCLQDVQEPWSAADVLALEEYLTDATTSSSSVHEEPQDLTCRVELRNCRLEQVSSWSFLPRAAAAVQEICIEDCQTTWTRQENVVAFLNGVTDGCRLGLRKLVVDMGVWQARSATLQALGRLIVHCRQLLHLELYFGKCQDTEEEQEILGACFLTAPHPWQVLKLPILNLGDGAIKWLLQGLLLEQLPLESSSSPSSSSNNNHDDTDNHLQQVTGTMDPVSFQLRELDLSGNNLSSVCMPYLSQLLDQGVETLQLLKLNFNRELFHSCYPNEWSGFLQAFCQCQALETASFTRCFMDGPAVAQLLRQLPPNLKRLDVNHNPVDETTIVHILEHVIPYLTGLRRLCLASGSDRPSLNAEKAFRQCLRRNTSLFWLDIVVTPQASIDALQKHCRDRNRRLHQVRQFLLARRRRQRQIPPGLLALAAARLVQDGDAGWSACFQIVSAALAENHFGRGPN